MPNYMWLPLTERNHLTRRARPRDGARARPERDPETDNGNKKQSQLRCSPHALAASWQFDRGRAACVCSGFRQGLGSGSGYAMLILNRQRLLILEPAAGAAGMPAYTCRSSRTKNTVSVIWDPPQLDLQALIQGVRLCHVESHKISRLHTHLSITTRNGIDYAHAAHCTLCSPGSGSGNLNRCRNPQRMQQDPMT